MTANRIGLLITFEVILLITLFSFFNNPGSALYALIVGIVFLAVTVFQKKFKPPKLSQTEFEKLDSKYKKLVNWIDGGTIVAVVVETAIVFFLFLTLKAFLHPVPAEAVFVSNPLGLLFIAAFLFSLATVGWMVEWMVSNRLGKEYWMYYYNLPRAGFDSKKVYSIITMLTLVLGFPALVFGLQDTTVITQEGIWLNDWTRVSPAAYNWNQITSISRLENAERKPYWIVSFSDQSQWNTSNERWNESAETVMQWISNRSGIPIQ